MNYESALSNNSQLVRAISSCKPKPNKGDFKKKKKGLTKGYLLLSQVAGLVASVQNSQFDFERFMLWHNWQWLAYGLVN